RRVLFRSRLRRGTFVRPVHCARISTARVLEFGCDVVPGPAVRAHPDRSRGRDRTLDSAGRRRQAVRQAVMVAIGSSKSNHRASIAVLVALVGVLVVPAAVALAHESGSVHLLDAVYAIPVAFVL